MSWLPEQFLSKRVRYFLPFLIVIIGFILQRTGLVDFTPLQRFLEAHAHFWWAPVLLVICMVLMYAFALPASFMIILAGAIYTPLRATVLTLIGGLLGALSAYHLVHYLSAEFIKRHSDAPMLKYMKKHAGVMELCALRIFPGFPHSLINYTAGLLNIPMIPFVISTLIGFAVKGFVYTSAVHRALHIEPGSEMFTVQTLWPLIALALLLALGSLGKKRYDVIMAGSSLDNEEIRHP